MNASNHAPLRIGIAFSGGGFRATLFHLGVVRAFRDANLLASTSASRITKVASVSGGSILATHLVLNWPAYSDSEIANFEDVSRDLIQFTREDVRGRILRRIAPRLLLLPIQYLVAKAALGATRVPGLARTRPWIQRRTGNPITTGLFVRALDEFFQYSFDYHPHRGSRGAAGSLQCLDQAEKNGAPELLILAVNITTAKSCCFSKRGFKDQDRSNWHCPEIPIAQAVAASAAYPGFFAPVRLQQQILGWPNEELNADSQYIVDGGIADNLGLEYLLELQHSEPDPVDLLFVSDASARIDLSSRWTLRSALGGTLRAIDCIMSRIGELNMRILGSGDGPEKETTIDFVRMGASPSPNLALLTTSTRTAVSAIRTDFDEFSTTSIRSLILHGYELARHAIIERGLAQSPLEPSRASDSWGFQWPVADYSTKTGNDEIEALNADAIRTITWIGRDPISYAFALIFLVVVSVFHYVRSERNGRDWLGESSRLVGIFEGTPPAPATTDCSPVLGKTVEAPNYQGFSFLEDIRVFDLRSWTNVSQPTTIDPNGLAPTDTAGRPSFVTCTKILQFIPRGGAHDIRLRFTTSGDHVFLATAAGLGPRIYEESSGNLTTKDIVLQLPERREAHRISVTATYVNSFQRPDQWYCGALVHGGDTRRIKLLVIFPEGHPFIAIHRSVESDDGVILVPEGKAQGRFAAGENCQWAAWEILDPRPNSMYKLRWDWPAR